MKHTVKLVGVKDDIVTLRVDGELCTYFIQRPTPLSPVDASLLRSAFDTRILESLVQSAGFVVPSYRNVFRRLYDSVSRFWPHYDKIKQLPMVATADFIKKVGVEVTLDKKTKGVVILESDVDKIREGKI